jgi:hypothetical protein
VTSWLALLLLWVSRFCADGRPPYLRWSLLTSSPRRLLILN